MKNVCCDKVEQKSSRGVEILRLVGCENLISQRKEFIFNSFVVVQR